MAKKKPQINLSKNKNVVLALLCGVLIGIVAAWLLGVSSAAPANKGGGKGGKPSSGSGTCVVTTVDASSGQYSVTGHNIPSSYAQYWLKFGGAGYISAGPIHSDGSLGPVSVTTTPGNTYQFYGITSNGGSSAVSSTCN